LRGISGKAVHALKDGRPEDYPQPIVDHAHERQEAVARYGEIKAP
jgi:deoxyribodipyrimidine photo-lyase